MAPAMKIRSRILLVPLLLASLASGSLAAPDSREGGYRSASFCVECHPEIHKAWASSEHATAFTSPEFQIPYDRIRRIDPARALPCEQCHNPMRFLLSEGDPKADIFAQEGVGCDFCHSVESVDAKGPWPRYRARPGIKFGPQGGNPKHPAHVTQFSRLHITSEFCAGCHEFRNAYGVPILTTSSEWEQSFYRGEQVHCQFCHLPQLFDSRIIDKAKQKGPVDHTMAGSHSPERLARAIPVKASLAWSDGEARLTVTLKNETVGHKTPSGLPMHRIRLASTLLDARGVALDRKEEVFERVIGDGSGKPIRKPEQAFVDGREVLLDNRIGPKESRVVVHRFPLKAGVSPASASVVLTYERPLLDLSGDAKFAVMPISQVTVPARAESAATRYLLVALVAIVLLAGFLALRKRG
jgi:nitrate/TMAO reductase-like tetraheme cytochrome c subunit